MTLALTIFVVGGAQTGSLLAEVVGTPTGKNGYEEYLMAADLCRRYADIDPGFARVEGMTLARATEETRALAQAIALVKAGNAKPVFDPRTEIRIETTFPEYNEFNRMSNLLREESYVRFASGQTAAGTDCIAALFNFGSNVQQQTLVSYLTGKLALVRAFDEFEVRLSQLSRDDAAKLKPTIDSLFRREHPLRRALTHEFAFVEGIDEPDELIQMISSSDDDAKDVVARLTGLGRRAQEELLEETKRLVREYSNALKETMRKPESQWVAPHLPTGGLAAEVVRCLIPAFDRVLSGAASERTRLRIASLHCSVVKWYWENNRLPESLEKVVGLEGTEDRLSGGRFVYERYDGGYRITSRGSSHTGPISITARPFGRAGF